jgi:hypothetical protein
MRDVNRETEGQRIQADARGSQVIKAVLDVVKTQPQFTIFLVNFRKGQEGHTIGIHLEGAPAFL